MKQMIAKLLLASVLVFVACTTDADEDVDTFDASVVCPADGLNKYGMPNRGTFIDERDGQEYKYTTIGDQVWMAENLNYAADYSRCYDDDPVNCDIYGRLYTLQKEGNRFNEMDITFAKTICPNGWHVPTLQEWSILVEKFGGYGNELAALRLKSSIYWENSTSEKGTNDCDFSTIPAGSLWGKFLEKEDRTSFWTTTAKYENMNYKVAVWKDIRDVYDNGLNSIRCLRD